MPPDETRRRGRPARTQLRCVQTVTKGEAQAVIKTPHSVKGHRFVF